MNTHLLTSSQTVGPFFAPALLREDARRNVLTRPDTVGERIRIEGRVLDGDGVPWGLAAPVQQRTEATGSRQSNQVSFHLMVSGCRHLTYAPLCFPAGCLITS